MLESFTLEGVNYSQQYRKCGKPTCQTCGNGGPGHGPYWYTRDQASGARRYIGRDLPIEVHSARQALNLQKAELYRLRDLFRQEAAALDRLVSKEPLSSKDREHIERLGFGSCLVAYRGQRAPQDGGGLSGLLVDILTPALVAMPAPAVPQDEIPPSWPAMPGNVASQTARGLALVDSAGPAVTQDAAPLAGSWVPSGGAWPALRRPAMTRDIDEVTP